MELEIKSQLDESGQPSVVADKIIAALESSGDEFRAREVKALSRFLLHAGLYTTLIEFVLRHFRNANFPMPWAYFLEAVGRSRKKIDEPLKVSLLEGVDQDNARPEASRSHAMNAFIEDLTNAREKRRRDQSENIRREKARQLDQLKTLRTQQLYEKEKQLLKKLQRMHPGDPDVMHEVHAHQQRHALEVLSKHGRTKRTTPYHPNEGEDTLQRPLEIFSEAMQETARDHHDLSLDLAVAAAMIGDFGLGLELLEKSESNAPEKHWLKLELLLGARRFLDLLNGLQAVEQAYAGDPETFFATAYLRAQALWGLGQRHQAVEVMETLLAARPQYRSGASMLQLWRGPA